VDKTTLVERDFEAGLEIVRGLEDRYIPVDLAAWLKDDETGAWQLLVSSPSAATDGTRPVYEVLDGLLREKRDIIDQLSLDDIVVAEPDERIVRELKSRVSTDNGLYRLRLHNARVYRALGDTVDYGARVRVRGTNRFGTVRGIIPTPRGQRFLVLYDLTPDQLRPLDGSPRPPVGQDYAVDELDFLYVVRTGGGPDRIPKWVADATGVPTSALTAAGSPSEQD
jgi:hypothetical protein